MDDFAPNDKELIRLQIKSLLVFEFLNLYNQFEEKIKNTFVNSIESLDATFIQKLYFYKGGKISTFIDYTNNAIKLNDIKFKQNDEFKCLSINQIVRLLRQESSVEILKFNIDSLQHRATYYEYIDCVIKLINMRNILSHELNNLDFHDKDLIEMLTLDNLKKHNFKILTNYDLSLMDDMTKYIASNIVYMEIMLEMIS